MAISPNALPKYDKKRVDEFERLIDKILFENTPDISAGGVILIVRGEITEDLRQPLEQRYVDAGWSSVEFKTSSENGERAGLTKVIMKV